MRNVLVATALMCALSACAGRKPPLPPAPAQVFPASSLTTPVEQYRIGPLDELSISVFREPDLSLQVVVDVSGNIAMPLAGQVKAENRTVTELGRDIERRLDRYLVDPRVTINVTRAASLKATVDGRVKKPGTYDIDGRTTLLQAVARAEGETETADLHDVVIFRPIDGQMYAARFDIKLIREGVQDDPRLRSGDTIVVGASSAKAIYQDFLKVAPFLGTVFIALRN